MLAATRRCALEPEGRVKHKTLGEFLTKVDPIRFKKMKPEDRVEVYKEEDRTIRVFLRSYFE